MSALHQEIESHGEKRLRYLGKRSRYASAHPADLLDHHHIGREDVPAEAERAGRSVLQKPRLPTQ